MVELTVEEKERLLAEIRREIGLATRPGNSPFPDTRTREKVARLYREFENLAGYPYSDELRSSYHNRA